MGMRAVVIASHELDAQQRLFIAAVRQAAELVGIVRVRPRPHKAGRLRRYARLVRKEGLCRALNLLAGMPATAVVRGRAQRALDAALSKHLDCRLESEIALVDVPALDGGLVNSDEEVAAIRSFAPDLLYQAGPGITKERVFRAAPMGMLHIHHGILPAIRGIASPEWAAREGRPDWLGVTLHLIEAGLDTGPIVAQARPAIAEGDTWLDVRRKLSLLGARLIAEGIRALADGLRPVPQPPELPSAYRSNLGLTDWLAFLARRRAFIRDCRRADHQIAIGQLLP